MGSLAVWNDSETLGGGTITSGDLSLELVPNSVAWFDASDDVNGGVDLPIADIAAFRIVPGDVVAYTAQFDIQAEGNNLTANLTADTSNVIASTVPDSAELLSAITTSVSATDQGGAALPTDGAGSAVITAPNAAAENQRITVRVEFVFDVTTGDAPGTGTDAQNQSISLEEFTLDLTQIRPL
ncbi:alternate-type signal peptide domain-containing protein [Rhodococcus sp. IEGM 1370]|nr:alternate-type signal peptide domain-containing protein [Rhodococcus sp. IEGM 1370]MDV8078657.1 alternate-type signal peptide domain-containing protein [Rhodococcus sp. IEGM 1370]